MVKNESVEVNKDSGEVLLNNASDGALINKDSGEVLLNNASDGALINKDGNEVLSNNEGESKDIEQYNTADLINEISLLKSRIDEATVMHNDKIEELTKAHNDQITQMTIDNTIENALIKANAKTNKAVKALIDMESITIDENGNVIGLEKQIEDIKNSDDTAYLFGDNSGFRGVTVGISEDEELSVEDMNYSQLCAYYE